MTILIPYSKKKFDESLTLDFYHNFSTEYIDHWDPLGIRFRLEHSKMNLHNLRTLNSTEGSIKYNLDKMFQVYLMQLPQPCGSAHTID